MSPQHDKIPARLKAIRIKKHLTQLELAEKSGVNVNTYARIERGELKLKPDTLEALVKALGVESKDILGF